MGVTWSSWNSQRSSSTSFIRSQQIVEWHASTSQLEHGYWIMIIIIIIIIINNIMNPNPSNFHFIKPYVHSQWIFSNPNHPSFGNLRHGALTMVSKVTPIKDKVVRAWSTSTTHIVMKAPGPAGRNGFRASSFGSKKKGLLHGVHGKLKLNLGIETLLDQHPLVWMVGLPTMQHAHLKASTQEETSRSTSRIHQVGQAVGRAKVLLGDLMKHSGTL